MKVALLAFLSMFFTKAHAKTEDNFRECTGIASFKLKDSTHELQGQCLPSQSVGAFFPLYTNVRPNHFTTKGSWECLQKWPDDKAIADRIKPKEVWVDLPESEKGHTTAPLWGVCKFGEPAWGSKKDVQVCKQSPLQCAPGPGVNWGACVAQDVSNWECIRQEEAVIDRYVKGDCLAKPVKTKEGEELFFDICRFATKADAAHIHPEMEMCLPEALAKAPERSKSACFKDWTRQLKSETSIWGSYRKEGDEESTPCEWTLTGSHSETLFDGECRLPQNGGIGGGWIALLIVLMLVAGGIGFLFGQLAKKTGPRALSGGLMR